MDFRVVSETCEIYQVLFVLFWFFLSSSLSCRSCSHTYVHTATAITTYLPSTTPPLQLLPRNPSSSVIRLREKLLLLSSLPRIFLSPSPPLRTPVSYVLFHIRVCGACVRVLFVIIFTTLQYVCVMISVVEFRP